MCSTGVFQNQINDQLTLLHLELATFIFQQTYNTQVCQNTIVLALSEYEIYHTHKCKNADNI